MTKECLICGERVDEHAVWCSKGHSRFEPSRTVAYSYDPAIIEEILRQSSVGYTEDEIAPLVDEITGILTRNRTPITKELVDTIGRNLKQDQAARKQREETERQKREERERQQREEAEPQRREEIVRQQREEREQREVAKRQRMKEMSEVLRQIRLRPLGRARLDQRHQLDITVMNEDAAVQFLLEHFKNANLQQLGETASIASDLRFDSNDRFWEKILRGQRLALRWVKLTDFA